MHKEKFGVFLLMSGMANPTPVGPAELNHIPEAGEIMRIEGRGRFRVHHVETRITTQTKGAFQVFGTDIFLEGV